MVFDCLSLWWCGNLKELFSIKHKVVTFGQGGQKWLVMKIKTPEFHRTKWSNDIKTMLIICESQRWDGNCQV